MTERCGSCRWFNGDGWLDDSGRGMGKCHIDPPVWTPRPVSDYDDWLESLDECWQHPMVGVAAKPCHRYERTDEERWYL